MKFCPNFAVLKVARNSSARSIRKLAQQCGLEPDRDFRDQNLIGIKWFRDESRWFDLAGSVCIDEEMPKTKMKSSRAPRLPQAPHVEKMTLRDLRDLEDKVKVAKEKARARAKLEIKEKIDRILAGTGLSIADLYPPARAIFRNPDNPAETWTGRGRKPNWVIAKLAKGYQLADFRIDQEK